MSLTGGRSSVENMNAELDWDAVVVGRSYAGLSTALTLGRARKSTLVIGDGGPRNEAVRHVHGLLTRDGANPIEFVRMAEADVSRYPTVELVTGRVSGIDGVEGGGFRISFGGRTTTSRLVVLATGVNDNPPPIPGLTEHWGRGVFTCPFCDGYERADRPWALVGDPIEPRQVGILTNWTDELTVFTTDEQAARHALADVPNDGWRLESRSIRRIHGDGESVTHIELESGDTIETAAIFVSPSFVPNSRLAAELGCRLDDRGFVAVDEMRSTSVDGVFAVGDVTGPAHHMSVAIAHGAMAGGAATHLLLH